MTPERISYDLRFANFINEEGECCRCGKITKLEYRTKLCKKCYTFFVTMNKTRKEL
jgi:hypothetical protein